MKITIYSIYVTFFSTGPLFLKFDRNSFPAIGLPYFGTSVRQKVDGDGGLRSRKHSSNNLITSLILSVLK